MNPKQSTESCVLNWESFSNTNIHCCMSGSSLHLGLGFFLWRFYPFFKRMFCKTICKESCHAGFKQKSETLGICSNHHVRCLYPGRSLSFQTISELFQHILKSMATPIRQESTGNLYQYIQIPSFPKKQIQTPIKWAYSFVFPPDAVKIALHYPPNFMMYPLHWTLFYFGLMPTISGYYWICECFFWVITDWTVWINAVF